MRLARPPHRFDRRHLLGVVLCLGMLLALLPALPAGAQAAGVEEARTLCIYRGERVLWADSASACDPGKHDIVHLPADAPTYLCVQADEKVLYATSPSCADSDYELRTVPTDGPVVLCVKNRKNGRVTKDIAEALFATTPGACGAPKDYSAYVTPSPPSAGHDEYAVDEDSVLTVPAGGVLENDTDFFTPAAELTPTIASQPDIGTVSLAPDGGFTYDFGADFNHLDAGQTARQTFTYTVSDGELSSDEATVTITISGVNDVPVAGADSYTTDEDTHLSVAPPGTLGNDTDAEDHVLSAHLVTPPAAGSLVLGEDGRLDFDPVEAFNHLPAGASDVVEFTYLARDGSADSAAQTVSITVEGVNDVPVAADDVFETDENTIVTITPGEYLSNDTDAEGTALVPVDIAPQNPVTAFVVAADGTITFDPSSAFDHLDDGQVGVATLTYAASDGAASSSPASVTINVTGLSAPSASDDFASTHEDTPVEIDILANDVPAGATPSNITSLSGIASFANGVLTFDPRGFHDDLAEGATRLVRVNYQLDNGEGPPVSAAVRVGITGVNDAPVPVAPELAVYGPLSTTEDLVVDADEGLLAGVEDVDTPDSELTVRLVGPPSSGRLYLQPDGSFRFDPSDDVYPGQTVTFRFRISDGITETATQTYTLTTDTDAPPALCNPDINELFVGAPELFNARVNLCAAEFGETYTLLSSERTDPPGGGGDGFFEVNAQTGQIVLTQGTPPLGLYELMVRVVDSAGQADEGVVRVRVFDQYTGPVDPFVAVGNTPLLAGIEPAADQIAITNAFGILGSSDSSIFSVTPLDGGTTQGGTVDLDAQGQFTYHPPRPTVAGLSGCASSGWNGSPGLVDSFDFEVTNNLNGQVTPATAQITVDEVIWYVKADPGALQSGCGTADDPYTSLAALNVAADDAPGQTIYLFDGPPDADPNNPAPDYSSPITLQNSQRLIGAGADLVAGSTVLAPGDPENAPILAGSIVLDTDNTLRGFTTKGQDAGVRSPGNVLAGALVIELDSISSETAPALAVKGGNLATIQVGAVTSDDTVGVPAVDVLSTNGAITLGEVDAKSAVVLNGTSGIVTLPKVTITNATPGLSMTDTAGSVDVGELDVNGGYRALSITDNTATVVVDELRTVGTEQAIDLLGNEGSITINDADVTEVPLSLTSSGLVVADNAGDIAILGGQIQATASDGTAYTALDDRNPGELRAPTLMWVNGMSGSLRNDAAVSLTANTDDAPNAEPGSGPLLPSSAESVVIERLNGAASVVQAGPVTDRGSGIRLNGNDLVGTEVTFSGGLDVVTTAVYDQDVDGNPVVSEAFTAMEVQSTRLRVTGNQNHLTADGASALFMFGSRILDGGMTIQEANSTGATYRPADPLIDPDYRGFGVEINGVREAGGTLLVDGGQISQPARGGVSVVSSDGAIVGAMTITEPVSEPGSTNPLSPAYGVRVRSSDGVIVRGTTIERAEGDGIVSDNSADLTIEGATITDGDGKGIYLPDPQGTTQIIDSSVRNSLDIGLHVDDAGLAAPNTVIFADSTVSGVIDEVNAVQVDTADGSQLTFRSQGERSSAILGGLNALAAVASPGATLNVDLSRTVIGTSAEDAILLEGVGIEDDDTERPDTHLTFSMSDMEPATSGGVVQPGRHGIHVVSDGIAQVTGQIARTHVQTAGDFGILLDRADGTTMDQVDIDGGTNVGLGLWNIADVAVDRLDVQGGPTDSGVEMWGVEDIEITRSRVDLRALPDQPGPDLDANGDPKPDNEQSRFPYAHVSQTCMSLGQVAFFGHPLVNYESSPILDGVSGIFGRHLEGQIVIEDTTVRGATDHEIYLFNGAFNPTLPDPEGRPTPLYGATYDGSSPYDDVNVTLNGLTLLDTDPYRAGVFAGSGTPGEMKVELASGTISTDASLVFCGADYGRVHVSSGLFAGLSEGPTIELTELETAIVLASATGSVVSAFLDDVRLVYPQDLIDELGDDEVGPAAISVHTTGGFINGFLSRLSITNSPGDGLQILGSSTLTYDSPRFVNPRGAGIVVGDPGDAGRYDLGYVAQSEYPNPEEPPYDTVVDGISILSPTIINPGHEGIRVGRASNVAVTDAIISDPGRAGVLVTGSSTVSFTGLEVSDPDGPAVHLVDDAGVSIADAELDSSGPGDSPRSGVLADNALPLELEGIVVDGFDAIPIDVTAGVGTSAGQEELPCVDNDPATTDTPPPPCTGTVRLSGLTTTGTTTAHAVRAVFGPDARPAGAGGGVELGGTNSLDAGMRVESSGAAVDISNPAVAMFDFTSGGDGLTLTRSSGALSADLDDLGISFSDPVSQTALPGAGLVIDNASGAVSLDGVDVSGAARAGIELVGPTGAVAVRGSSIDNTGGHALNVTDALGDLTIEDNTVTASALGIRLHNAFAGGSTCSTIQRNDVDAAINPGFDLLNLRLFGLNVTPPGPSATQSDVDTYLRNATNNNQFQGVTVTDVRSC